MVLCFRFVSDIGLEGYQQLCQHKALQCANIEPKFSRVYPPCLLEWRAIQQKANMALEARFPDGELSSQKEVDQSDLFVLVGVIFHVNFKLISIELKSLFI